MNTKTEETIEKIKRIPSFYQNLTLIFITLKLIDKIDWSWWWILSPILIYKTISMFHWLLDKVSTKLDKKIKQLEKEQS